jgi:hypothetical protein
VLTGGIAGAALIRFADGAPAHAAGPIAGKQAPSVYRYRIGTMEVTVVSDGARTFPLPDNFVVNVKKEDVNAALESAYMPRDKMTIISRLWLSIPETSWSLLILAMGRGNS